MEKIDLMLNRSAAACNSAAAGTRQAGNSSPDGRRTAGRGRRADGQTDGRGRCVRKHLLHAPVRRARTRTRASVSVGYWTAVRGCVTE